MGLSSNTFLHQTDFDGLDGILKTKSFRLSYSKEDIYYDNIREATFAYPMICFSDIPLSQITAKHLESYGGYIIGMKREWIVKNKFNPVFYYNKSHNLISKPYISLSENHAAVQRLSKKQDPIYAPIIKLLKKNRETFHYTLAHSKPYEGFLYLKKKKTLYTNYRFSDEREWRFIPSIDILKRKNIPIGLTTEDYETHKHLAHSIKVKFELQNINFIIIPDSTKFEYFTSILNGKIPILTSENITNDILGTEHNKLIDLESIKDLARRMNNYKNNK